MSPLRFRNSLKNAVAVLLALVVVSAWAGTPDENRVKERVQKNFGKNTKVDEVRKTPYSGLYEVRSGGKVIYTDSKAKYIFAGHIFEMETGKNLTKARLSEINKVKFSDLPLDLAVKTVRGNGKRKIAVFSDPQCGHCRRLEKTLEQVDNITVYTFMYNILSKESANKARNIWCSGNPSKAWGDWMKKGKIPKAVSGKCEDPGQKVYTLGRRLNISGTPTIFFTDGTRIPGAIDARMLKQKLAQIK